MFISELKISLTGKLFLYAKDVGKYKFPMMHSDFICNEVFFVNELHVCHIPHRLRKTAISELSI